jgi:hypothetical protein
MAATTSPELVPSDGQETIVCEHCDETLVQGNSIVLFDTCESCEAAIAQARAAAPVIDLDCDLS